MDRAAQLYEDMLPFSERLGLRFVSAELDRITGELEVRSDHCTRPGTIHGGVLMSFADSLGAAGAMINLPDGARTSTIESKTNFIGPAMAGERLTGEATPIHRGRSTMVWQTRISTEDGRLVAMVTQTQIVLPGRN